MGTDQPNPQDEVASYQSELREWSTKPIESGESGATRTEVPVKLCWHCGAEFRGKSPSYCSEACKRAWREARRHPSVAAGAGAPAPPSSQSPPSPPPLMPGADQAAKSTPELITAVLTDYGRGLTLKWACAKNHCSYDQWQEWEKWPEFPSLRDERIALRVCHLMEKIEWAIENKLDWKGFAWQLERIRAFQDQFADPSKISINVSQTNNTLNLMDGKALERVRQLLDETEQQEQARLVDGIRLQDGAGSSLALGAPLREVVTSPSLEPEPELEPAADEPVHVPEPHIRQCERKVLSSVSRKG